MVVPLNHLHRSVMGQAAYSAASWRNKAQADPVWLPLPIRLRPSNHIHCSLLRQADRRKDYHKVSHPIPSLVISQVQH